MSEMAVSNFFNPILKVDNWQSYFCLLPFASCLLEYTHIENVAHLVPNTLTWDMWLGKWGMAQKLVVENNAKGL